MKRPLKHYCIILLFICLSCHTLVSFASSPSQVDTILNTSYSILLDIQNQLHSITRNGFINLVNNQPNDIVKEQLIVFENQIEQTRNTLNELSNASLTRPQTIRLQALLAISSYLEYIKDRNYDFFNSNVPYEQYDLLNSIFIGHSLIDQVFRYITPQ